MTAKINQSTARGIARVVKFASERGQRIARIPLLRIRCGWGRIRQTSLDRPRSAAGGCSTVPQDLQVRRSTLE